MKEINYVEYKHSYAHVIQPKLRTLNYYANVNPKPANYLKKIVIQAMNEPSVLWTEKEHEFFDSVCYAATAQDVYYMCKNAVNKAYDTIVPVDDAGELI